MPSRFDGAFDQLNRRAQRRVLELLEAFEDGRMSRQRFQYAIAAAVSTSKVEATAFGDVAMAVALGTAPLGIPSNVRDPSRWARAAGTLLDFEPDTVDDLFASRQLRFARLARAETASQVQDTMQVSMQANGVEKWVRRTEPEPCPLCTELADGVPRPTTVRMARHEGCVCHQDPVPQSQPWGNSGWANVNPRIREEWAA